MNNPFCTIIILLGICISSCVNPSENGSTDPGSPLTGNIPADTVKVVIPGDNSLLQAIARVGEKMDALKKPEDFDLCFSYLMIIHHEGTIEMAQYAIESATSEELKTSARKIIVQQSEENRKLQDHIDRHKTGIINSEVHEELLAVIRQSKSRLMDDNLTGNPDRDYAELMIQHLQNGIDLATQEILNGHHVQLKLLAKSMLSDMQNEQEKLGTFLSKI